MDFLDEFYPVEHGLEVLAAARADGASHPLAESQPPAVGPVLDLMSDAGLDAVLEQFDDADDALFVLDHQHGDRAHLCQFMPSSPSVSANSSSSAARREHSVAWPLPQDVQRAMMKLEHVPLVKEEAAFVSAQSTPVGLSNGAECDSTTDMGTLPLWSREDALKRYRAKRERRSFKKVVRYDCRKKIAASRPRIGGRFARRGEIDRIGSSISLVTMTTEQ
ncbi:Zinc finger protein CONSTANS-LIKE 5 [Porphyridium purpureum]|uniref:Zinc finger protein CONSTANS-LIKE 5 n=1 Tax=Porphyridium purpureum TaxID=35688 RepID=A0A5J4YXK4_PORPP|nr:Zinc finger protein CONSTANS-LIKE 5 [Porphyridium purpureum]|eukprot:POR7061..scf209_3